MMPQYKVTNSLDKTVERGGFILPPLSTKNLTLSDYQRRHLNAKVGLKVEPAVQEVQTEPEPTEYPCPYCDEYVGKTEKGLQTHIRMKHQEVGDENV